MSLHSPKEQGVKRIKITESNPKMNREFFTYLPSEITIDIVSRLPVRTIKSCKCVCKTWLNLVLTREFAKSHLSKSVQGLAVFWSEMQSGSLKIFEFEDGLDLEHHELHYNPVMKFDFPDMSMILGSATGLLLLLNLSLKPFLYVCNPITREYIKLPSREFVYKYPKVVTYGFGASKIIGQHKVVRISLDCTRNRGPGELLEVTKFECHVYTLGTGSWRRIAPGTPLRYESGRFTRAFLNGNLHWLVFDFNNRPCISCFDLETELFSTFSSPPLLEHSGILVGPFALGECLCLCDNTSDGEIVIWLMKEYGVEKSWTKEFVISKMLLRAAGIYDACYPIKIFKDGDILMVCSYFLFYYSKKSKTTHKIDMFEAHSAGSIEAILHTPSFFSLKSFAMENVSSF